MTERYRPNVTVACVIHSQGKFLLVEEEIEGQIRFNQPAGHLEANESLPQACVREVFEETGLQLELSHLLKIYQFSASGSLAFLRFTFVAELAEPLLPQPQDPQIKAAHWFSIAEIEQTRPQHRSALVWQSIQDYLQNQGTALEIINANRL